MMYDLIWNQKSNDFKCKCKYVRKNACLDVQSSCQLVLLRKHKNPFTSPIKGDYNVVKIYDTLS